MAHHTAALLIIGNEILSGRTRDANAWLATRQLFERGCQVKEIAVVGDERQAIIDTLRRLRSRYDAVITSGGIGPTHDDITMDCVAEALGVALEESAEVVALMRQRYGDDGLNDGRRRMARLPHGAQMIVCAETIAPGAHVGNVYVLAGVPPIFASQLASILDDFGDAPFHRAEVEANLAESLFAHELGQLQADFPDVEIGSYPARCGQRPSGKICLTSRSADRLAKARSAVLAMLNRMS